MMKANYRRLPAVLMALALLYPLAGCTSSPEKVNGQDVHAPGDPELEEGPVFKQSKFRVYVVYRPQVQYRDFNGILDIHPDGARIVRKFWKERFNALTRPGHYGEFFLEFFDCMSSFAQAYPVETREKERMLDSLEKSFHAFCMALKIDDQFVAFQKKQQELYGD